MAWYDTLRNIDRRIIFLLILFGVAIPLKYPIGLPIEAGANVRRVYDYIEALRPGDAVMLSFDYDPGSRAEVHPMAEALIHHCFKKNLRVICPSLWPVGPSLASEAFTKIAPKYSKKEGEDYVNLGYFLGSTAGVVQVTAFAKDLRAAYPSDVRGEPTDRMPVFKGIHRLKDLACVVSLSAGDPGIPGWVQIAKDREGVMLAGGGTAVQAPQFFPLIQSGQLFGFLGGLRGAAEYETLVAEKGTGTSGMDAQSVAHLIIIVFIVLSNITYYAGEMRKAKPF